MTHVSILDCTLRDGGYVNDFHFGQDVIKRIVQGLENAFIPIIECGFLQSGAVDCDKSLFGGIEPITALIAPKKANVMYVAMIAFGEIAVEEIAPRSPDTIDGIRITFHEHETDAACTLCRQLMDKGYDVFMQPVGSTSYSDQNMLALIARINGLCPFAFYMVDTLGVMYKEDLLRMFFLVDKNLHPRVKLGFHSHNNTQLSFSNAQELMQVHTKRHMIIDASIYGMGRGAGNLCTELITQYINENETVRFDLIPLLEMIDDYINPIRLSHAWGYSAPYYLSSILGCHPNYALHLINKQTISVKDIYALLSKIPSSRRILFDQKLIERLYLEYQYNTVDDSQARERFCRRIAGHKLLLIAPGHSLTDQDSVRDYIEKEHPFVIQINFIISEFPCDLLFISNLKRFDNLVQALAESDTHVLVTSNIAREDIPQTSDIVDYASLLASDTEADNSGAMLLRLLVQCGVTQAALAGFDGFSPKRSNYYTQELINSVEPDALAQKNAAIHRQLRQLRQQITLHFITPSLYEDLI